MATEKEVRIRELQARIEDLKKRLSAHRHKMCATKTVHTDPPEMIEQLEEMEDELKKLQEAKE